MPRRRYQQPSVEKRQGKRSYWRIRYAVYVYENGKEVRRRHSKFLGYCPTSNDRELQKARQEITKREAERAAALFMAKINDSAASGVPRVLLRDFLPRWTRDHVSGLAKPTQVDYQGAVDNHLLPDLGDSLMSELTTEIIQQWLNSKRVTRGVDKGKPLSWNSKAGLRNVLRCVFARAIDWGYWEGLNPVDRVKLGKKRAVYNQRLLTDQEADALMAKLPEKLQVLLALLRATGCRISEAMALGWEHFDLSSEQGWVRFEQRNWRGDIDVTKSPSGRREFPLGPKLTTRLRALQGEGRVFDTTEGVARWKLVEEAKKLNLYFRGFGFHSFRREFGTVIQEHGASSIEAAVAMGHSRPVMTQRYTKARKERMEELARKLEGEPKVVAIREVG